MQLEPAGAVTSFGAKGDAVTDATASIQTAIDTVSANGGGVVMLSTGTYLISATLDLPSNVTIAGEGPTSVLLRGPSLLAEVVRNASYLANLGKTDPSSWIWDRNLGLRDLTIDCRKRSDTWMEGNNAATFSRCDGVAVERVTILDSQNDGVILEFCKRFWVTQCTVTGCAKAGIYLSGSDRGEVNANTCTGNYRGISVAAAFYCTITGNTCLDGLTLPDDRRESGIGLGRDSESCTVTGNVVQGLHLAAEPLGHPLPFHADHPSGEPWIDGYRFGAYRNIIAGNIIFNYTGYGLSTDNSDENTIESNRVFHNGAAIVLLHSQRNTIRGNHITSSYQTGNPSPWAILLEQDSNSNIVEGNIVRDTRTPPIQYGIADAVDDSDNIIVGNYVNDAASFSFLFNTTTFHKRNFVDGIETD